MYLSNILITNIETNASYRNEAMSPHAIQAVLGAVATLSLASAINYYRTVDQRNRHNQDRVQTYMIGVEEQRFREVESLVPPDAVVGYVIDESVRRDAHWPTNSEFISQRCGTRWLLVWWFVTTLQRNRTGWWASPGPDVFGENCSSTANDAQHNFHVALEQWVERVPHQLRSLRQNWKGAGQVQK